MKKVLALTLVLVLALGMSTVAFAQAGVLDKKDPFNYGLLATIEDGPDVVDGDATNFDLPLYYEYFNMDATQAANWTVRVQYPDGTIVDEPGWDDWEVGTATSGVPTASKALINKNEITLKVKWSKGSDVFDSVSIKYNADKTSYIAFRYKDAIKSIKDIPYKYQLLVLMKGRTANNTSGEFIVEGTYEPEENDGYWSDDWFRFEGRNYLKPTDYVRNMEYVMNEDEDMTVWGRALKGVKYYGHVSNDWNPSDEKMSQDHPEIVGVYHVAEINLKTVTDHVTFNNEDGELYVYDGDLNYLGQVKDKITSLEDTYYLASAQLDVDNSEPDDIGDDDDDEPYDPSDWGGNADSGGDDLYPENPHDNPGTGK